MCLEHLGPIGEAVRERLGLPHRVAKLLLLEARPDPPTAGHREEPHLAIARLAPEELEHGLRIGTGQPFGFGHGRSAHHNYPTSEGDSIPLPRRYFSCLASLSIALLASNVATRHPFAVCPHVTTEPRGNKDVSPIKVRILNLSPQHIEVPVRELQYG